jgi:hypothetical protein
MLSPMPRSRSTLGIASPGEGEQRREVSVGGDEDAVLGGRARQHLGVWSSGETDPDDVGRVRTWTRPVSRSASCTASPERRFAEA